LVFIEKQKARSFSAVTGAHENATGGLVFAGLAAQDFITGFERGQALRVLQSFIFGFKFQVDSKGSTFLVAPMPAKKILRSLIMTSV
jgi:hypothetical protein